MSKSQTAKSESGALKVRTNSEQAGWIDCPIIAVDSKTYSELLAKLESPPRPNARLRRSLTTTAPWEK
jgi:hypothetical protein